MPAISTGLAIGLGALSAGTSIVGGVLAKKGAESQAQAAERASAAAVAENRRQFDLTRQDLQPWIQSGSEAVRYLSHLLGLGPAPGSQTFTNASGRPIPGPNRFDPDAFPRGGGQGGGPRRMFLDSPDMVGAPVGSMTVAPGRGGNRFDPATFGSLEKDFTLADFEKDPGYEFRLAEGQKAIERSAAARGGLFSGRQLKDINRYGQEFASNEYGNAFNRFEAERSGRYNRFANLAGLGQTTAVQLGGIGADNARTIGDIIIGGQTAAAASRASGYNALAQGIQGGVNSGLNWFLLSKLGQRSQPGDGLLDL